VKELREEFDVAVIGGGMAGICAAVASARSGAATALVQDRPVLGGNASSEIRVHINGAQGLQGANWIERETGILEETLLENRARNPQESWSVWSHLLHDFVTREDNLTLYLNTHAYEAETSDGRITAARCHQATTERTVVIGAKLFVDCSGDGLLGAAAGAEWRLGREGKDEFGEKFAPTKPDKWTMGSSLYFWARDAGKPVPYEPPHYAYKFKGCDDLAHRPHGDAKHGHWWIEVGSESDPIGEQEEIRDKLLGYLHGFWDHIKNSGQHPEAANYEVEWFGSVPGKRESRRFVGDHMLTEGDQVGLREFPDAVAFGGWPIDDHCPGGIESRDVPPTNFYHHFDRVYQIPLRSLYSKNVDNLLFAGRNASCSHIAMASSRVMATCAVMGQAAGTAAAMCAALGKTPRELAADHIDELQERLLRDDAYIPHRAACDEADLARSATLTASGTSSGDAALLTDGVARDEDEGCHHWQSDGLPAWVELAWDASVEISSIEIKLDSNLHRPIQMSPYEGIRSRQLPGLPPELVSDLVIEAEVDGEWRELFSVAGNRRRLVRSSFEKLKAARVRIRMEKTYGHETARVFEVRCYG